MTIITTQSRITYAGDNVTTSFPIPFEFFLNSDITTIKTAVGGAASILTLGIDFTLLGAGVVGGGSLIKTSALLVGETMTIFLNPPIAQGSHYQSNAPFPAGTLEYDLDRQTQISQRLQDQISRSIRAPDADASPAMLLPSTAQRALQYLGFDAAGNPLAVAALPGPQLTQGVYDSLALTSTPFLNMYDPVVLGSAGPTVTPGQAFANLGGINMAVETTITATTAMTLSNLGRSYYVADSGSPVPYTITLPAGAPIGSIIQFRISSLATQLYTITGNDKGIDGDANRVLWRNETCLLIREASNWAKIGGRTVPFRGLLQRGSAQSIASGTTFVACALNQENGDTYALNLCLDVVNSRFKCPRHSSFLFNGNLVLAATVTVSAAVAGCAIGYNSSTLPSANPSNLIELPYAVGLAQQPVGCTGVLPMNQNDFVQLLGRIYSGTIATPAFQYSAGVFVPSLSYAEIPLW